MKTLKTYINESNEPSYEEARKNAEEVLDQFKKWAAPRDRRKFSDIVYVYDDGGGDQYFALTYKGDASTMMLTMDSYGEPFAVYCVAGNGITKQDDKPAKVKECILFDALGNFLEVGDYPDLRSWFDVINLSEGKWKDLLNIWWNEYSDSAHDEYSTGVPYEQDEYEDWFWGMIDKNCNYYIKPADPSAYYTIEI